MCTVRCWCAATCSAVQYVWVRVWLTPLWCARQQSNKGAIRMTKPSNRWVTNTSPTKNNKKTVQLAKHHKLSFRWLWSWFTLFFVTKFMVKIKIRISLIGAGGSLFYESFNKILISNIPMATRRNSSVRPSVHNEIFCKPEGWSAWNFCLAVCLEHIWTFKVLFHLDRSNMWSIRNIC